MPCRILSLTFISLCFVILLTTTGNSNPSDSSVNWTLVWNDEFDGPSGQSPNASKWEHDIGTDWGNAQLEYDTDRPSNVSLDGSGNLAIIAREESYMGRQYTSARIVTRDLYEPTYGRVEARIKLPTGQGIWPAFWLLGNDINTVGWPQCGEIDIMEYLGHQTNTIYGTLHGPGYSGGGSIGESYVLESGQFDTEFHLFAVEWEENVIRWYMDDVLYLTLTPEDLDGDAWVFDHPFYIILNVAVGGHWPGSPDGSTVFPQTMLVDYVRVYQQGSSAESCCQGYGGNVDNSPSDAVDISDLVYLVDFMFNGGAPPPCLVEANIDGLDEIDIADLVYLVDYMFTGGPMPPECPTPPDFVFIDEFHSGVFYQAFAGSKLDAVQIDQTIMYAGTQGLAITVPNVGDPSGSYAGGAFTTTGGFDLTEYSALTFWAKASMAATLDVAGIGNNNTGTSKYVADVFDLSLTTVWQKYVIPIPEPSKLDNEQGLFYFAEGPENGTGYQIWIDEIIFETLTTITNPRPVVNTQTIEVDTDGTIEVGKGTVTFDVDGTDLDVIAMPGYFTFASSNESVVSISADGTFDVVGIGTATLTASLGTTPATGEITVNVNAPPGEPATPASTPTVNPANVISLFSDAYTDVPVDTWSAGWDQADVEDHMIGSDNTKKYSNLVYAGIEFTTPTIDATAMTHFHMDVWTPDPTAAPSVFRIKLVDFGANGVWDGGGDDVEHEITLDESIMNTGSWVSIELPLSSFTNLATTGHLAQMLISGDLSTVYVDNIYFHDVGLPTAPTVAAPMPTVNPADIISLFSDVYTDVPVDTWSAAWDVADVEDYLIGSDNTKKYTNLLFAGIEFITTVVDASEMTHFHMDVWTPDATASPSVFNVKLVDFGANGVWDGGDDVEHEISLDENSMNTGSWVSIELSLSDFINLTTKEHLAQLIISGDPNTIYVDNVYFHK